DAIGLPLSTSETSGAGEVSWLDHAHWPAISVSPVSEVFRSGGLNATRRGTSRSPRGSLREVEPPPRPAPFIIIASPVALIVGIVGIAAIAAIADMESPPLAAFSAESSPTRAT